MLRVVAGELETTSLGDEEDVGFIPLEEETGLALGDLRQLDLDLATLGNQSLFQLQIDRRLGLRNVQA